MQSQLKRILNWQARHERVKYFPPIPKGASRACNNSVLISVVLKDRGRNAHLFNNSDCENGAIRLRQLKHVSRAHLFRGNVKRLDLGTWQKSTTSVENFRIFSSFASEAYQSNGRSYNLIGIAYIRLSMHCVGCTYILGQSKKPVYGRPLRCK